MRAPAHIGALSFLALSACFAPSNGIDPPLDRIYFPVGLALSHPAPDASAAGAEPKAQLLYVVNSDFDLQYNGGSLAAYDLGRLSEALPAPCAVDSDCTTSRNSWTPSGASHCDPGTHFCVANDSSDSDPACGPFGAKPAADVALYPGRCHYVDPVAPADDPARPVIADTVEIGAFATDVIVRQRPVDASEGASERLFIPVRGDATLHWVDVKPELAGTASGRGRILDCGQGGNDGACDDAHRSGKNPDDNSRRLRMQSEPFAIDATADGRAIVVTNQTTATVSLFVNEWSPGQQVTLEYAIGGLPASPVGVAAVPVPAIVSPDFQEPNSATYYPGFLIAYSGSSQLDLVRFYCDGQACDNGLADYPRSFVFGSGSVNIAANSVGVDSRGIAVDASEREAAEAPCNADYLACVASLADGDDLGRAACRSAHQTCLVGSGAEAHMPRVFVSNRAPATLLVGALQPTYDVTGTNDLPAFNGNVPLTLGPSRVVLGRVRTPSGALALRVFVVCFDSRRIFIYDPDRRVVEGQITTGRGPHAFVVDEARSLGYVGHFTDSYIGVVSLDQRYPDQYGAMIATIGQPTPPRASK